MKIVIAGAGEVGFHLARMMTKEAQDIVVIDDDSSSDSPIQSSTGKSSTKIIVVEASVNSVVDKQLLTNLA
mgnify:CR=1 FL=1